MKQLPAPVAPTPLAHGLAYHLASWRLHLQFAQQAFLSPRSLRQAITSLRQVRQFSQTFYGKNSFQRYVKVRGRYYFDLNVPGTSSLAFKHFVDAEFERVGGNEQAALQVLVLEMTKSCTLACEHCVVWDSLNQAEGLSTDELQGIIAQAQDQGITQILLTGGEPLRRIDTLMSLLKNTRPSSDVWILTSGVGLTLPLAQQLADAGLIGIQLSLDHWDPAEHDRFRGRPGVFQWVERAAAHAHAAGLVLCLNLCLTPEFVTEDNLNRYLALAQRLGAGFIQLIEAEAIGHYKNRATALSEAQYALLNRLFERLSQVDAPVDMPLLTYHHYQSRRLGCMGSGQRYLYVDADGMVHACPFCRSPGPSLKTFPLADIVTTFRSRGCKTFQPKATP